MVDAVEDGLHGRRHAGVDEERLRRRAVGGAGGGEAVAVPKVAVEVVLVERAARQPTDSEGYRPENQAAQGKGLLPPPEVQVEAQHRQAGPGEQEEERRQRRLARLPRQHGQRGVPQRAPDTHRIDIPGWRCAPKLTPGGDRLVSD